MDLSIAFLIGIVLAVCIGLIGFSVMLIQDSKYSKILKEIYEKDEHLFTGDVFILSDNYSPKCLSSFYREDLILENLCNNNGDISLGNQRLVERYKLDSKYEYSDIYYSLKNRIPGRTRPIFGINTDNYDQTLLNYIKPSQKTSLHDSLVKLDGLIQDLLNISQDIPSMYKRNIEYNIRQKAIGKSGFLIIQRGILDEAFTIDNKIDLIENEKEDYLNNIRNKKSIDQELINTYNSRLEELSIKRIDTLVKSFSQILENAQENSKEYDTELTLNKWHKARLLDE